MRDLVHRLTRSHDRLRGRRHGRPRRPHEGIGTRLGVRTVYREIAPAPTRAGPAARMQQDWRDP